MLDTIFSRMASRAAGIDLQILRRMALFPAERRAIAALGVYLLGLGLLTAWAFFYMAYLVLVSSSLAVHGVAAGSLLKASVVAVLACLLVVNIYRLLVRAQLPTLEEPAGSWGDSTHALIKIATAAVFGAIVGIPVALVLSANWHDGTSSWTPQFVPHRQMSAGERLAVASQQQDLFLHYLARDQLLSAVSSTVKSGPSAEQVRSQLEQLTQKIEAGHLARLETIEPTVESRPAGLVTRLEALSRHDPVFLVLTCLIIAFLFSVPVLSSAMRRRGVYEYLQAMQNVCSMISHGVIPREIVIRGTASRKEYVRDRFLLPDRLTQFRRQQISDAIK